MVPIAGSIRQKSSRRGLDALDFCRIDPVDHGRLPRTRGSRACTRDRVIPFLNLGYVHEQYPAFLRACDDMARGATTDDTRLLPVRGGKRPAGTALLREFFLQGLGRAWCWSEGPAARSGQVEGENRVKASAAWASPA